MEWKKLTIPLSLALAAGLFTGAPASAQDTERPADRPRAERKAPPAENAPRDRGLRIRRVRPLTGQEGEAGQEAVRPRPGPRARPGPRPEMGPGGGGRWGVPHPRLRMLLMRLREVLIRHPELAPRLERWLEAQVKDRARGAEKGKPKRGKPVRGKKVPPKGKGKAKGKRVPPPEGGKHEQQNRGGDAGPAADRADGSGAAA